MQEMQEMWFDSWVRKIPWSRKWQTTIVILPGKFPGWGSLVYYSPWGCKESNTTEHMCTHSCINNIYIHIHMLLYNQCIFIFLLCWIVVTFPIVFSVPIFLFYKEMMFWLGCCVSTKLYCHSSSQCSII